MKQRSKTNDINTYQMPTPFDEEGPSNKQKKYKVLYDRYEEVKTELNEHQLWEKGQTEKASMKLATAMTEEQNDKKYEYVFENQIDFIKTDLIEEMNIKKKPKKQSKKIMKIMKRKLKEKKKWKTHIYHKMKD